VKAELVRVVVLENKAFGIDRLVAKKRFLNMGVEAESSIVEVLIHLYTYNTYNMLITKTATRNEKRKTEKGIKQSREVT
jgi:hypothetical protein